LSVNPGSLNNQSKIELRIDKEKLTGFEGLQVVRSIDSAADAYSFSLPWDATEKNIDRFRPFFVRKAFIDVDGKTIVTGYLEKLSFSTSAAGRRLNVQGRSASGTILDWSAGPPFQFENLTFNNISKELSKAIHSSLAGGVVFANLTPEEDFITDTPPIAEVTIEPGDTFFKIISSLASSHGLWARPTATGLLEYRKFSSTRKSVATLFEGISPVRVITSDHDVTKRFQNYMVIGTSEGNNSTAEVSDYESLGAGVRGRQISELGQQTTDINQAAKFARSKAVIDSYTATAEIDGWHYNGVLWNPGDIITVKAPGAFILNPTRLIIVRVTYKIDESGGQAAILDLGIPNIYDGTEPKLEDLPWVG